MQVVIIGNGLTGTIAAKTIRDKDSSAEIDIYTDEKHYYYPRPNLLAFIAGNIPKEKIFAYSGEWYKEHNINVHLWKPVTRILPDAMEIEVEGGERKKYNALFLANGSLASVPPFKGIEKKGLFTLRTLDEALAILDYLKTHSRVAVIGGGLLGLEVARAIRSKGVRIEVVEFFDRLLPRQLDVRGSSLLKSQIEKTGIKVRLGLATEEILGQEKVRGIKFKGGEELQTDMVVVAAGVKPNISLAMEAGLETDRGVVVDDYLQTSHPKIFAGGDIIQHRGKIYGIIPASFEQARLAAYNILGQKKKYEGTVPWNSLKVAGINLTSIGLVNPENDSQEEIIGAKTEEGIYKKIIIDKGVIVGALWLGTKEGVDSVSRAITQGIDIEKWKHSIVKDDFDFSLL